MIDRKRLEEARGVLMMPPETMKHWQAMLDAVAEVLAAPTVRWCQTHKREPETDNECWLVKAAVDWAQCDVGTVALVQVGGDE